jgi:hypothetical protein
MTAKNAGKLMVILIAMQMWQYNARVLPDGAHPWPHAKPLDAAIRRVPTLYCPGSRHGQQF